jgi:8-oxo-dGTP diphosphatase
MYATWILAGLQLSPVVMMAEMAIKSVIMVVNVAIGLVCDQQGRYCVSQRRADVHLGALWEFPGGKCIPGEPMLLALQRELHEELDIVVQQATSVATVLHDYSDLSVRLHVFRVEVYEGEPKAMEGQPLRWVSLSQLTHLPMPAANQKIVAQCMPWRGCA